MTFQIGVQPTRKSERVEDRPGERRTPRPLRLIVEESHIETVVVGDKNRIANERTEPIYGATDGRGFGNHLVIDAGEDPDGLRDGFSGIDQR